MAIANVIRAAVLSALAFLVTLGSFADAAGERPRNESPQELIARNKYGEALTELRQVDWRNQKTPRLVKLYCQVAVGAGLESASLPGNDIPRHIQAFAEGYAELLKGNASTAIRRFHRMQKSGDDLERSWGDLGLLETGLYADNVLLSIEPLEHLKFGIRTHPALTEELAYFEGQYALQEGNLEKAAKILRIHEWSDRKLDAAIIGADLALRKGEFDTALRDLQPFDDELNAALIRTKVVLLKEGPRRYRERLAQLQVRYPENSDLKLDALSNDLFWGVGRSREAALSQLADLVVADPKDFRTSLYATALLMDAGDAAQRERSLHALRKVSEMPLDFARFHLIQSKIYRRARQYEEAKNSLQQALAMAPANLEVLREAYILNVDLRDYARAKDALQRSLEFFPNSPDLMIALADICIDVGDEASARKLVGQLDGSPFWYDKDAANRLLKRMGAP